MYSAAEALLAGFETTERQALSYISRKLHVIYLSNLCQLGSFKDQVEYVKDQI